MAILIHGLGGVAPDQRVEFLEQEPLAVLRQNHLLAAVSPYLADRRTMLLGEEGKLKSPLPPVNAKATALLAQAGGLPGDVVPRTRTPTRCTASGWTRPTATRTRRGQRREPL